MKAKSYIKRLLRLDNPWARNTVFEGEAWADRLPRCRDNNERQRLITDRFGEGVTLWEGKLFCRKDLTWDEMYGLLSLFRKKDHLMNLPIRTEYFRPDIAPEFRPIMENLLKKGKIYAHLQWNADDSIDVRYCVQHGDCGDSEGFGVEPDTWLTGILGSDGTATRLFNIYE